MAKKSPAKKKDKVTASEKPWYLRYSLPLLALLVIIVYGKSIGFNYSYLDDTAFIFDHETSNEKLSSLINVFHEGTFNTRDIYYRPLFRITFILERQVLPQSPEAFTKYAIRLAHFDNIVLHIISVWLLFLFLQKISFTRKEALAWSCLFAVLPVLTMAVSWVPGRNDLLLSVFTLAYLIHFITFIEANKKKHLIYLALFLLLALFTKETAVFIPLVSILYLIIFKRNGIAGKVRGILISIWAGEILIWYFLRQQVLDTGRSHQTIPELISTIIARAPALMQYIGKIFLPFNLSVYPFIDETTSVFGIVAVVLVALLLILNKQRDNKMIIFGLGWFILFLFPFFLAPNDINGGIFEHRLYIPVIGMILITREALNPIFTFLSSKNVSTIFVFLVFLVIFSTTTFVYSDNFANEIDFYNKAVKDSPNSSFVNRMYGTRLLNRERIDEAIPYFRKAFQLNTNEPFVRYFLAKNVYLKEDSIDKAKQLLLEELKFTPEFPDNYFELSHIAYEQHDLQSEKKYTEKTAELDPKDDVVNTNLLKIYIDLYEKQNAKKQLKHMQDEGLAIDNTLIEEVSSMPDSSSNRK